MDKIYCYYCDGEGHDDEGICGACNGEGLLPPDKPNQFIVRKN